MKTRTTIFAVILAEVIVISLGVGTAGWSIDGLQATTRFSGRFSLILFSFIFLLHPNKKSLLHGFLSENYFLIFAIAHGIHLIELLSFVYLSGTELVLYRVAGGFLAYVIIFLMPWLKFRADRGELSGERLTAIGYVYIFYVWFIFFMTYIGRLNGAFSRPGETHLEHRVLMGWVCIMLGIKIAGLFLKKSKA